MLYSPIILVLSFFFPPTNKRKKKLFSFLVKFVCIYILCNVITTIPFSIINYSGCFLETRIEFFFFFATGKQRQPFWLYISKVPLNPEVLTIQVVQVLGFSIIQKRALINDHLSLVICCLNTADCSNRVIES